MRAEEPKNTLVDAKAGGIDAHDGAAGDVPQVTAAVDVEKVSKNPLQIGRSVVF